MMGDVIDIESCAQGLENIAAIIEGLVPKLRAAAGKLREVKDIGACKGEIEEIFHEYEILLEQIPHG